MNYIKTEVGQKAFKERTPLLSGRQRSMFILFDGARSPEAVLAATAGLGTSVADVVHMVEQGFLTLPQAASPAADFFSSTVAMAATEPMPLQSLVLSQQERYRAAKPLATALTATLGLRGVWLNLAVERAEGFEQLRALLPKIQDAAGVAACRALEQVLNPDLVESPTSVLSAS